MTTRSEYVDTRWGRQTPGPTSSDLRQIARRNTTVWQWVCAATGATTPQPPVDTVHSVQALPATIDVDGERSIVWDAGLGTLLVSFSFMLPYPQAPATAEAVVRRVLAVRLTATGQHTAAGQQAAVAREILREHPVDRGREYFGDAESRFADWVVVEVQERFALAHEYMHYLRGAEPDLFSDLTRNVLRALHAPLGAGDVDAGWLDHPWDGYASKELPDWVDPYSWCLLGWRTQAQRPELPDAEWWSGVRDEALAAVGGGGVLAEEVVCDVYAAAAVAVGCERRGDGWTLDAGVVNSRAALESLDMLHELDRVVRPSQPEMGVRVRAVCLEVALPVIVCDVLRGCGELVEGREWVREGDLRVVLHLGGRQARGTYQQALSDALRDAAGSGGVGESVSSYFRYVRPEVSDGHRFWLGVIDPAPDVVEFVSVSFERNRDVARCVQRHARGDWGDVPAEDAEENEAALWHELEEPETQQGLGRRGALYSSYVVDGVRVLVMTSADRSVTRVSLLGRARGV